MKIFKFPPVDILLETVNIWILGNIGSGLLHGGADMLDVLHQLVNKTLNMDMVNCYMLHVIF